MPQKILKIVIHPNKILDSRAKKVDLSLLTSPAMQSLVSDMAKTLLKVEGAGLAAPQVNKGLQLAVINTKDGVLALFNPRLTKKSLSKEWGEEGCLSVPGFFGEVKRHKKVTCEFYDKDGEKQSLNAEGLLARVIQHELDHLNGILFISKARNLKRITGNDDNGPSQKKQDD